MSELDDDARKSKYIERYDRRSPEIKYKRIEELLESGLENKHYPLFLVISIFVPMAVVLARMILSYAVK